jgi:hypothetical protein
MVDRRSTALRPKPLREVLGLFANNARGMLTALNNLALLCSSRRAAADAPPGGCAGSQQHRRHRANFLFGLGGARASRSATCHGARPHPRRWTPCRRRRVLTLRSKRGCSWRGSSRAGDAEAR